ncbi:MAG: Coenzyme F420 hydrogenase/dehydrogenase, beta subunit C-terminal domain, partial [Candidatus Bathyarchaeia archaeon]
CSECFDYHGLIEKHLKEELGLNPVEIMKMNIKGRMIIDLRSGRVEVPLKRLKAYTIHGCESCPDFSAEFADVSAGGVGLEGWTLTVIRSVRGEEIFNLALGDRLIEAKPVEKDSKVVELLLKLTKNKRERLKKRTEDLSL